GDYSWFQSVENLLRQTNVAPEYDKLHALFPNKSVDHRKAAVLYFINSRLRSTLPLKRYSEIDKATGSAASRIPLRVLLSILDGGADSRALRRGLQRPQLKPHAEAVTDILNLLDSATQAMAAAAQPKKIKIKTRPQSEERVLGSAPNFVKIFSSERKIFSVKQKTSWLAEEIDNACGSNLPNGITPVDVAWFLRAFMPSGEGRLITVNTSDTEIKLRSRSQLGSEKWRSVIRFAIKEGIVREAVHPGPHPKFGLVTSAFSQKLTPLGRTLLGLTSEWLRKH
ncbi:MAG: hypothetical protein V1817_01035, partial [Candidatus Micrarchaeota archaeon]